MLASLLGAGRLPLAPGTFGALLGVLPALGLHYAALHPAVEAAILVGLVGAAVAVSGRAQHALGRTDPPEVIVDEFVSVPVTLFLVPFAWYWWAAGFVLNRALDVLKPPPIRALQRLPGGWGIVADDVAAAVVANAVVQVLARVVL